MTEQTLTAADAEKTRLWLAALERERYDTSWRTRAPRAQATVPTPKTSDAARRRRDRVFFDAGRYAAGARDEAAIMAHAKLTKGNTK